MIENESGLIEKFGIDYLSNTYKQMSTIFVDIDMFLDFELGAIMNLIKNDEEYSIFKAMLPNYLERVDRGVMRYFEGLPYTDTDVKNYICDPDNSQTLMNTSPEKEFAAEFIPLMQMLYNVNRTGLLDSKDGLELIINNIHFETPEDNVEFILNSVNKVLPMVDVVFTHGSYLDTVPEMVHTIDAFILNNLNAFVNSGLITQHMVENGVFLIKNVYATIDTDKDLSKYDDDEYKNIVGSTSVALSLLTNFTFVKNNTIIHKG